MHGQFILNGEFGDRDRENGTPNIRYRNKTGKPAVMVQMKLRYMDTELIYDAYFWSFDGQPVIWPYVSSSRYMIVLSDADDQVKIFEAIKAAGIDLATEMKKASQYSKDLDYERSIDIREKRKKAVD